MSEVASRLSSWDHSHPKEEAMQLRSQPPTSDQNVVVRTYRWATEYEHDAAEMARKGWIQQTCMVNPRAVSSKRRLAFT
jgi:hypothetical protein